MTVHLCREEDAFLDDKPVWIADLSNGERIWKDDFRPGVEPPQAWKRLSIYVSRKKLAIEKLQLKFRGHIENPLPAFAPGYFFSHKVAATAFSGETSTIYSFLIGHFDSQGIHIQEWLVPALIQIGTEYRTLEKLEEPACLIINNR